MARIIYLPPYAKKQLETSYDADIWAKPIPFRDKPEKGFTSRTTLGEATLELEDDVLREGMYYPDMDQEMECTLECIETVKVGGKKKYSKPGLKQLLGQKNTKSLETVVKLTVEDFAIPIFDKQPPKKRLIPAREEVYNLIDDDFDDALAEEASMMGGEMREKKEPVIEGWTVTDNFKDVGYTYHCLDGTIHFNYLDRNNDDNVSLFETVISSAEEFEKCLKKADQLILKHIKFNS